MALRGGDRGKGKENRKPIGGGGVEPKWSGTASLWLVAVRGLNGGGERRRFRGLTGDGSGEGL